MYVEHARLVAAHNARDAYARERDCETYAAGKFTATGDGKNHGQFETGARWPDEGGGPDEKGSP